MGQCGQELLGVARRNLRGVGRQGELSCWRECCSGSPPHAIVYCGPIVKGVKPSGAIQLDRADSVERRVARRAVVLISDPRTIRGKMQAMYVCVTTLA